MPSYQWVNHHLNSVTWVPAMAKTQKISKNKLCKSYTTCEEMTKNSPTKTGLTASNSEVMAFDWKLHNNHVLGG